MLQEQKGRLAGTNGKVLLNFLALFTAEGRISKHYFVAIFLLNIGEVFTKRVGVDDVGRLDSVQDHVHDRNHVCERLLFLAVKCLRLKSMKLARAEFPADQIVMRLTQKP